MESETTTCHEVSIAVDGCNCYMRQHQRTEELQLLPVRQRYCCWYLLSYWLFCFMQLDRAANAAIWAIWSIVCEQPISIALCRPISNWIGATRWSVTTAQVHPRLLHIMLIIFFTRTSLWFADYLHVWTMRYCYVQSIRRWCNFTHFTSRMCTHQSQIRSWNLAQNRNFSIWSSTVEYFSWHSIIFIVSVRFFDVRRMGRLTFKTHVDSSKRRER